MIFPVKVLADLGFEILATQGTAEVLRRNGVHATVVRKHFDGPGPERRADDRAADPRRRDRPGHQHPARLVRRRRLGRASTATRSAPPRSAPTSRASPPSRGSAPPCRASRRSIRGDIGVRSLQDWAAGWVADATSYDAAVRAPVADVRRRPRERRTACGVRGRTAAGRASGGPAATRVPPATRAGQRHGPDLPAPRSGSPPASTRTPSASTRWPRWASATSRSAPSPASRSPATRRPRLFRLPADRAVVNRMGFNNDGAEAVAGAARAAREASADATRAGARRQHRQDQGRARGRRGRGARRLRPSRARLLAPHADYLVVNVSSPNTPGPAQPPGRRAAASRCSDVARTPRWPTVPAAGQDRPRPRRRRRRSTSPTWPCDSASTGSSPPTPRSPATGLRTPAAEVEAVGAGGLSGAPLAERSLEVLRLLRRRVGDGLTLVSVGGIATADDARARLDAGATLVRPTPASSTAGRGGHAGSPPPSPERVTGGPPWVHGGHMLRLVGLLGGLSVAMDMGTGAPLEESLRRCVVAGRLADVVGCAAEARRDVLYSSLLEHLGCTAYTTSSPRSSATTSPRCGRASSPTRPTPATWCARSLVWWRRAAAAPACARWSAALVSGRRVDAEGPVATCEVARAGAAEVGTARLRCRSVWGT